MPKYININMRAVQVSFTKKGQRYEYLVQPASTPSWALQFDARTSVELSEEDAAVFVKTKMLTKVEEIVTSPVIEPPVRVIPRAPILAERLTKPEEVTIPAPIPEVADSTIQDDAARKAEKKRLFLERTAAGRERKKREKAEREERAAVRTGESTDEGDAGDDSEEVDFTPEPIIEEPEVDQSKIETERIEAPVAKTKRRTFNL